MSVKIAKPAPRLHLDIVVFHEALSGLGLVLVDALRIINTVMVLQGRNPEMQASWQFVDVHGKPLEWAIDCSSGPSMFAPYAVNGKPRPVSATEDDTAIHAFFIPPFLTSHVPALRKTVAANPVLIQAVQTRLNAGHMIVTMGNSLWFAAGAVQAVGRSFAVPWIFLAGFAADFPDAIQNSGQAVVQDGPFISAASLDAWLEAILTLLTRMYPEELVQTVRVALAFDHTRQAVAVQAASEGVVQPTRDSVLALAIAWLNQHQAQPYSLTALADTCKVSTRTLLRHFDLVLGMSPLNYLHRQRCQRACYLLETTLDSVHSIAQSCGYVDANGFRKVFFRLMGCSPKVYRLQRRLRTPRVMWKAELDESLVGNNMACR